MNCVSHPTTMQRASPAFRSREVVLLLCFFAILSAMRLPDAWSSGRFLDEEVTVFFAYAWNFGTGDALFRSFAGYWNLAANGSTVLLAQMVRAGVISLERAPYVTMLLGLASQMVPIFIVLRGEADWLGRKINRIIAALLIVVTPVADEVYLNVVHVQFHLALAVGLILALDVPRGPLMRWSSLTVLMLGPLCGPGSILFLPLFVVRALVERSKGRVLQCAVLAVGAAIQLAFFYSPSAARGLPMEPFLLLASLLVRLLAIPSGGPFFSALIGSTALDLEAAGNHFVLPVMALAATLTFGLLIIWAARRRDAALWLVSGALLIAVVSLGLGAAGQSDQAHRFALTAFRGPRYNYIPLVLLSLAILVLANRPASRTTSIARALVIVNLVSGAIFFRVGLGQYQNGISWPDEVSAWRRDRNYQLRAWPETARADLSGRRAVCPRNFPANGNSLDPRYCESGWIAGFNLERGK